MALAQRSFRFAKGARKADRCTKTRVPRSGCHATSRKRGHATCSPSSAGSSPGRKVSSRALAEPQPGESKEELERIAEEDRRLAKEGLVPLMDQEGETYHLHIDELGPEDVADRVRAERARSDWLGRRKEDRYKQVHAGRRERRSGTEPKP